MATAEQWAGARAEQRRVEAETAAAARTAMGEWVGGLQPWSWLVTHTYDHEKVARRRLAARGQPQPTQRELLNDIERPLAVDVAWAHWRKWVRDVSRRVDGPVYAFSAVEPHRNGWPHFHTVVSFDARAVDEVRAMHGAWFDAHGFIQCKGNLRSSELAAFYASKMAGYTTKQLGDGVGWLMSRELVDRVKHDARSMQRFDGAVR